jgi:hypothetical protein
MKTILLTAFALLFFVSAQAQVPGKSVATYTTSSGRIIHVGDTLTLGLGQQPDGSFKYSELWPNMLNPNGGPLPASYALRPVVVTDIKQIKFKMHTETRVIFKAGMLTARMMVDVAEASGELPAKKPAK